MQNKRGRGGSLASFVTQIAQYSDMAEYWFAGVNDLTNNVTRYYNLARHLAWPGHFIVIITDYAGGNKQRLIYNNNKIYT